MIRKEVHTRSKFASQEYYKRLRKFLKTQQSNGLDLDGNNFLYLTGTSVKHLHKDLERCLSIYEYYTKEYNDNLGKNEDQKS